MQLLLLLESCADKYAELQEFEVILGSILAVGVSTHCRHSRTVVSILAVGTPQKVALPLGNPDIGDFQNYGPFWGPYYNTGPSTGPNLGDPKRDHNFDNPPYIPLFKISARTPPIDR